MAEEAAAHHLLNVLEERDLNVDLDKVLAAFEDREASREAAAWVNEYLNEGTLLTREELELYQTLRKKGVLQQYEENDDPIRPILDHELSSAIDSLQNSTAAIEEQCKVLEAQRDALMALKGLDKPNLAAEHLRNERRRKEHQEKARLDIAVEDVATTLSEQITDTQRDIDASKSTLKSYLTDRLTSDDKILTALPGIVSKILTIPEPSLDETSVEQWCNAIVSFRTSEIKARVDTIYLASLSNCSQSDLPNAPEEELRERKQELQSELETLYSEIASVAEMVVDHELRTPMTDIQTRKEREVAQARSAWLKYVLSTLDFMAKRLDTISNHTKDITDFQSAIKHINISASERMPDPSSLEPPSSPTKSKRRGTLPSRQNSAFASLGSIKLKPRTTLNLPSALQDALRQAGISYTQDSLPMLRESLIKTQLERDAKLSEHYESSLSSSHDLLAEQFGQVDTDARVILDRLYSYTPFASVTLTDSNLEREVKNVENEVREKEGEMRDLEGSGLSLSDPVVRRFVGRWGK